MALSPCGERNAARRGCNPVKTVPPCPISMQNTHCFKLEEKDMTNTFFKRNKRYIALLGIIIALIVIFSILSDSFFSFGTLKNFIRQNAVLYVASIGMMITMLAGGLDLAIGAEGALAAMLSAMLMERMGSDGAGVGITGILITVLVGLVIGLVNGFFVGYMKISPFMTTLAMQSICRGATTAISGNSRISISNPVFTFLGAKIIPIGKLSLPVSIFLVIGAAIFAWILLKKMAYGRKLYAVGGNATAATCSGINSRKVILMSYVICSMLMTIASIVWAGRTMSATPLQGEGLEFNVLTAVILGGCSLAGGSGTLAGTLFGATIFGLISTGIGMVDTPPYVIYWIQGAIIIGAVYLDIRMNREQVHTTKKEKDAEKAVAAEAHSDRSTVLDLIAQNKQTVLELEHISKEFPGVKALDDVSIRIEKGRVHAIMGENGAGKSTLMKILTGVYSKDAGQIKIDGHPVEIRNPIEAQKYGISIIYQEFALVQYMSVAQNVFLGKEIPSKLPVFLDRRKMRKEAGKILEKVNLKLDVNRTINELGVGQQQMVEIGKVVGANSWVVVMDEPTAALTEEDKEKLFAIIRDLKKQGVAIVYISHRMAEIFAIADDVTVLRDGKHIITAPVAEIDENTLIRHMVGRELTDVFSREKAELRDVVLEVRDLKRNGVFDPISFQVRAGEVLGFAGLMGSGRTEIMRCLFGLDKYDGGEILIDGKKVNMTSTETAIREGICMVSEDRRGEGIISLMSVKENTAIASLPKLTHAGIVDAEAEEKLALEYIDKLNIKTPSPEQKIGNLSGGNQQKVCVAKWLAVQPRVIIMDEPTRGIDVGAKAEIHKIIEQLAKDGMAVILISSELPEIMGASDRIIVLYEGEKSGEFIMDESVTQEMIMECASGM